MRPFVPERGSYLVHTPDPRAVVGAQVIHTLHGGDLHSEYILQSDLVMRFGDDFPEYTSVARNRHVLRDYNEAMALIEQESGEHITPFLDRRIEFIEAELDKWLSHLVRQGVVQVGDEELYSFETISCFRVDGLLTYLRAHGVQG